MIKLTKHYLENIFFVLFSFILSPFLYSQILVNKLKPKRELKILVIQLAKIGDLVCSTPVFREIKKKYPKSHLSVLIIPWVKGVIENNPYIDEIILIDRKEYFGIKGALRLIKEIKKRKFDLSFSLLPGILNNLIPFWAGISNRIGTTSKYATRGAKILSFFNTNNLEYKRHTLTVDHYLNLLKFVGIQNTNQKKEIFTTEDQNKKASQFLEKQSATSNDFLVGISVGAGNELKQWSIKKFANLADELIKKYNAKIIFVGSAKEKEIISKTQKLMKNKGIDVSQDFSLSEAPALFRFFKLFISVDTGSLYMANAMNVPVIDIAGPIDIYEQPPLGDKCKIVQKKLSCIPCSFVLPPARECKNGSYQCIKDISVEDVLEAVNSLNLFK